MLTNIDFRINCTDLGTAQPQLVSCNIAFARGGAHLPIAHALPLFLDKIEIEKKQFVEIN